MGAAVKRNSAQAWPEGLDDPDETRTLSPKRLRASASPTNSDLHTPSPPQVSSLISSPLLDVPLLNGNTSPPNDTAIRPPSRDSEAETEALSEVDVGSLSGSPQAENDSHHTSTASSPSPQLVNPSSAIASPVLEPIELPASPLAGSVEEIPEKPELNQGSDMEGEDEKLAAQNDDEARNKSAAVTSLEMIEKQFNLLKDRIYEERIAELDAEILDLEQEEPTNIEFLGRKACIDEKLAANLKILGHQLRFDTDYKQKAAVAEHYAAQSQYFQEMRQLRQHFLAGAGQQWFKMAQDTKQDKAVPEFGIPFPTDRVEQIQQQHSQAKEVSILAGFAEYKGFPAAPTLDGLASSARDEELKSMRIRPKVPAQKPVKVSPLPRLAVSSSNTQPAAEDLTFFELNPWAAYPQRRTSHAPLNHSSPLSQTPPISHTPVASLITHNSAPQARAKEVRSPLSIGPSVPTGVATGGSLGVATSPTLSQATATIPKRRNYADLISQSMPTPSTPLGARLLAMNSASPGLNSPNILGPTVAGTTPGLSPHLSSAGLFGPAGAPRQPHYLPDPLERTYVAPQQST